MQFKFRFSIKFNDYQVTACVKNPPIFQHELLNGGSWENFANFGQPEKI